ncbi:Abhydrolase-3 domain-containing protein [Mycena kentingensis (nom. inval.)]|nr:Abhydrolase-3 domain-containing protein [Mycena kentingensis (nom. inval.)]
MAEYAHLSVPDPEFAPLLERMLTAPTAKDVPMSVRRQGYNQRFAELSQKTYAPRVPHESNFVVQDHQVGAGASIRVRSVVPLGEGTFPLLVWAHGGGWISGTADTDDLPVRAIAHEIKLATINIEYRLAPEHRHPTQINDCLAAIKWAISNASLLRADLNKGFILAGLSAGAHLMALLAHRLRDDPFFAGTPITGQVLQFPLLVHPDAYPEHYKDRLLSYQQNKQGPILSSQIVLESWYHLLSETNVLPSDPTASPLLALHNNLPPTVIQVAGLDPLRDEGLLYNDLLRNAGVKTRLEIYPGLPHTFNYPFGQFRAAKQYEKDYRAGLRWLLAGAPDLVGGKL